MTNEIKTEFERLLCRLSPENLHCDGECSAREVRSRLAQIKSEWRDLEKLAGRRVSEDEAWALCWGGQAA